MQTASLLSRPQQTRKLPDKQVAQIQVSIKAFGQVVPILINAESEIVDGQAIHEAN